MTDIKSFLCFVNRLFTSVCPLTLVSTCSGNPARIALLANNLLLFLELWPWTLLALQFVLRTGCFKSQSRRDLNDLGDLRRVCTISFFGEVVCLIQ